MAKKRLNISLDQDLVDFVKLFAAENRTTVAEGIAQYLLRLKRRAQGENEVCMIMEQPLAMGEPLNGNFVGFYSMPGQEELHV